MLSFLDGVEETSFDKNISEDNIFTTFKRFLYDLHIMSLFLEFTMKI